MNVKRKFKKTLRVLDRKNLFNNKPDPVNELGIVYTYVYDTKNSYDDFIIQSDKIKKVVQKIWEPDMIQFVMQSLYCYSIVCSRFRWFNLTTSLMTDNSVKKRELYQLITNKSDYIEDLMSHYYYNIKNNAEYIKRIKASRASTIRTYFYDIIIPLCRAYCTGKNSIYLDSDRALIRSPKDVYFNIGELDSEDIEEDIVLFLIDNFLMYIRYGDAGVYDPFMLFPYQYYNEFSNYLTDKVKRWSEV